MPEIEWHVFERILAILCLCDQPLDSFAQESLVLGLRVELLGGQFDQIRGWVVARP